MEVKKRNKFSHKTPKAKVHPRKDRRNHEIIERKEKAELCKNQVWFGPFFSN